MKIPSSLLLVTTSCVGVSHGFSLIGNSPRRIGQALRSTNNENIPAPPSVPSPPDTPVTLSDYDNYDDGMSQKVGRALKKVWFPIVSGQIEKGVPSETIKGAALTASLTSVFVLGVNPMMVPVLAAAAASGAYVAVTPGPSGDMMRSLGRFNWILNKSIVHFLEEKIGIQKTTSVDDDEDLGKILKEARNAVKLVKNEMKPETPQDKAKRITEHTRIKAEEDTRKEQEEFERQQAGMKAKEEEAARLAEEANIAAEETRKEQEELEQRQIEMKAKEEEAARLAEEAKIAEEETRKEQEELEQQQAEMKAKEEEAARLAEESNIAAEEETRKEQEELERRQTEMKAKEEEAARLAEEAKIAADENRKEQEELEQQQAEMKAKEEEAAKLAEEAKIAAEENRKEQEELEQQQAEMKAKEEEAAKVAEAYAKIAAEEETRKEQEELERQQAEMKAKEEEAARLAEEAKIAAEETRKEQEELEQQQAEMKAKEEEAAKLAEEAKIAAEEERLAAEEEEIEEESGDEIDEDDWEESIQLAQSLDGLTEQMNGDSDQWKEAQDLAKKLALESNEEVTEQGGEMEDLGRAARAAVEKYEAQMKQDSVFKEKIKHNQQAMESSPPDVVSNDTEDFESMKVVELKDELRSRGLKVSGRKAELIERLKQSTLS